MRTEREQLLLAVAVAEYATAIDHLEALKAVGVDVPYATFQPIYDHLVYLCEEWLVMGHAKPALMLMPSTAVEAARAHVTEHQAEIDALLRENGWTHDDRNGPD